MTIVYDLQSINNEEFLVLRNKKSILQLDIHLKLISLDTEGLLNLLEPYLCCRPTLLVRQLREVSSLPLVF